MADIEIFMKEWIRTAMSTPNTSKISLHSDSLWGLGLATLLAWIAQHIVTLLNTHLIGASVLALLIGMLLNPLLNRYNLFTKAKAGLDFAGKKILRCAIILLGSGLSLGIIWQVGRLSLLVMFFTLLTCFGGGYFIGRWLSLPWRLSSLINAGTGICGGSAIAAISPVIEAEDRDVAYALSATFLFDMAMILLFPIMGHALGLSDIAYGLWTGTAVNDTSSVVAAGYAFSERAGDFATTVKLTRTLSILPTVLIFSLIQAKSSQRSRHTNTNANANATQTNAATRFQLLRNVFPFFILGFLVLALLNSIGAIPISWAGALKQLSKFLFVIALAAIGLKTNFSQLKKAGYKPMLHGFIISTLVIIVAILVEYCIGLV